MRVTIAASAEPKVTAGINKMLQGAPESGKISGHQTIDQIEPGNRLDLDAILDAPGDRQQIKLAAEKINQHDAEPKIRQRNADQRDAHAGMIEQ